MQAKQVAATLRRHGISVASYSEGLECEDGMVVITPLVHVQVPTYGSGLNIVREEDGGNAFRFYPVRTSMVALLRDLREALGLVEMT